MGFAAMSMLIASCRAAFYEEPASLTRVVRETLRTIKKEVRGTIILTTKKVKCNEVDHYVGNKIIAGLTETIKLFDTLVATSIQLEKTCTKEEILQFAERTNLAINSTLTNLRSLHDLYDISTYSQFETTTFFPADSINISPEKTNAAKKAIEPVSLRITRFFVDHPRQKFEAVIACSSTPADEAQARAVANLLVDQIRSNEEFIPNPDWIHYYIKWVDEGARIHPKSIDKRLSMVSLTWSLLPASLDTGSSDLSPIQ